MLWRYFSEWPVSKLWKAGPKADITASRKRTLNAEPTQAAYNEKDGKIATRVFGRVLNSSSGFWQKAAVVTLTKELG